MNNYSESDEEYNYLSEQPIDIIGQFIKYTSYWKWFVVSLIVCMTIAVLYLEFALPTYKIKTSILFKDDVKGGGSVEMTAFKDMSLLTQKNNVDNELKLLKSSLIVEKVIRELGI